MTQFLFDVEPEPALPGGKLEPVAPPPVQVMPSDQLQLLLTFLPDVRLKGLLEADAAAALAVDVTQEGGLLAADEALAPVREDIKAIEACFETPTSLANQLHKRLTGLRADFCAAGEAAVKTVGQRIYDENQRQKKIADEARRLAQAEADRQAREAAAKAAEEAARIGVAAPVVEALKEQAKTASAPPVRGPVAPPKLRNSTTVESWKARLAGTPGDQEPNPLTKDMTEPQRVQLLALLKAIVAGSAPLALVNIDWSAANKRAAAEKTAMAIAGLEAFDAGGVRAKAGRR